MGYTSPLEDTKFVLENLLPPHEEAKDFLKQTLCLLKETCNPFKTPTYFHS